MLDENSLSNQTLEELAKALNVSKSIVYDCLHAIGKIQKESKWVLHELSKLAIQNRFNHLHFIAFLSQKEVGLFLLVYKIRRNGLYGMYVFNNIQYIEYFSCICVCIIV